MKKLIITFLFALAPFALAPRAHAADKRIKDITTTATSPAADDYFVIDGATNNMRKLAALPASADLASGTTLTVGASYYDTFTANRTLTFSGTASEGARISLSANVTTACTLTVPTSYRYGDNGSTTTVTLAVGNHALYWERTNSKWYLVDTSESGRKEVWLIPIGDETTAITTGTAKVTFRAPYAVTVTAVRATLTTVSSSGTPTFDINDGGTTILSTKLTVDASEKTSTTAATAAVISDTALADDAEVTIDVDTAGTGAAGAKIAIYVTRT